MMKGDGNFESLIKALKMYDFFRFSFLLLLGQFVFSAADDECKDVCTDNKPTVDVNGNILMTVWYDNDDPEDPYQWNANMVIKACLAMGYFKEKFSVDFIIGSGSRVSDNNELICKHDCTADRLEGCAALHLDRSKFLKFVCCNNNGGSDHSCFKDQGVDPSVLDDCVNKKQSDKLLMANGDKRRRAGIPGCHVPEFSFNNVVDRCTKIPTFDSLKAAICEVFKKGNISIENCKN